MSQLDELKTSFLEKKAYLFIATAVVGLLVGFGSSTMIDSSESKQGYCDRIESQVMEQRNISGTLACFPPGIVEVNLTEEVENNSELKCVCRHSYNGLVQMIPISVSD